MDGDLQHPPATIGQMIQSWREGNKIVETRRIDSGDTSFFKRLTSSWFYGFFSLLSGLPIAKGTSDFRLLDRQVVETMKKMKDSDLFLRGLSHWVGYEKTTIPYQAVPRHAGRTKYSLFKMIRFATSSMLSFSVVPLRLGIWLGLFTSMLAFAELVYILVHYLQGNAVPGWASILTVISFMFGILFILIGILGAYLGSIFETLKNRPRFLVNETSGFRDA
jgi:dolichol-phosphate mannosyltransferase